MLALSGQKIIVYFFHKLYDLKGELYAVTKCEH